MKYTEYKTKFVKASSDITKIEEGVLYLIPHYNCAMHKCMCGCGEVVITPIDDNSGKTLGYWGWTYDGSNASLIPSVGNFQQPCKSHYFLKNGKVQWC